MSEAKLHFTKLAKAHWHAVFAQALKSTFCFSGLLEGRAGLSSGVDVGVGAENCGEAFTGVGSGLLCFCVAGMLFFAAEPLVKDRVPAAGSISSTAYEPKAPKHILDACMARCHVGRPLKGLSSM